MIHYYSPAKINLFLRIVTKESNGYHCLSSLFQTVSLCDSLTFLPHTSDLLTSNRDDIPLDHSNLVLKALALFKERTGCRECFKIHLDKQIPIQAGLGGGSSNAATTLYALNEITNAQLDVFELKDLGSLIGSDVPFFFSQGRAFCQGRGERITPLPISDTTQVVIVKPSFGLSTSDVYRSLGFSGTVSKDLVIQDLLLAQKRCFDYFNDLEKSAFTLAPKLQEIKLALLQGGFEVVLMSGSGSSFFCLGQGSVPSDIDCLSFNAHFISREIGQWYNP